MNFPDRLQAALASVTLFMGQFAVPGHGFLCTGDYYTYEFAHGAGAGVDELLVTKDH